MIHPLPPQAVRCIRALRALGLYHRSIAKEIGCCEQSVLSLAKDVPFPGHRRVSREEILACREEAGLGPTYRFNRRVSDEDIDRLRKEVPMHRLPLKSTEIARIHELQAQGFGYRAIADLFGTTEHQIRINGHPSLWGKPGRKSRGVPGPKPKISVGTVANMY